jgi:hypothetical protein
MPKWLIDVLHYGTGLTLILAGGLSEIGVSLPGISVSDPKTVMGAGIGIIVAGLKGGVIAK